MTNKTSVFVAQNGQYLGHFTFTDTLRPEAKQTIQQLRNLGVQHLIMVTGDKKAAAQKVAKEVGIDTEDVFAECLPEEKINHIQETIANHGLTAMVGDGINDAPALATASVGIAMGAHGATAASETADVVILKDDFSKVAQSIMIAKDTVKIAQQSVLIGIAVCVVLMFIASFGLIPTFIGAMFQEVVDVVAIISALRAHND